MYTANAADHIQVVFFASTLNIAWLEGGFGKHYATFILCIPCMMAVGGVRRTCGKTSQYIMQNVALQLTSLWSINNQTSDHMSMSNVQFVDWYTYVAVRSSEHASNQCTQCTLLWPLAIHEIVSCTHISMVYDYCAQLCVVSICIRTKTISGWHVICLPFE